jgi:hypothetical protein
VRGVGEWEWEWKWKGTWIRGWGALSGDAVDGGGL